MLMQITALAETSGVAISSDTFAPVITQIVTVIGLALVAGMSVYAVIKGVKMVPKALGWFIKG